MRLLDEIDSYFDEKSKFETFALFALFALVVGSFLHLFFFDGAKKIHTESEQEKIKIKEELGLSQKYLDSITRDGNVEYKINILEKDIENSKLEKNEYLKKMNLIDERLKGLSGLLFNRNNWSQFLNSITTKAASNGITIESINNKYVDNSGSFGHVLEIGIKCKGDFNGIVGFINDMEQSTLVTDIYSSRIKYEENSTRELVSDINISVWGVNH